MKRTPLRRKTPLRARKPMRRTRLHQGTADRAQPPSKVTRGASRGQRAAARPVSEGRARTQAPPGLLTRRNARLARGAAESVGSMGGATPTMPGGSSALFDRRDPVYLARVRGLACCAIGLRTPCRGPVHAHHAGGRPGVAIKAHDHTAVPLCMAHHGEWHAANGAFHIWNREKRRSWSEQQIATTQAALGLPFDPERDRLDEAIEIYPIAL